MNQATDTTTDRRSDELLAIRCQLGEREAFHELIERYASRLRGYVRRVADSDAEADDLVQDTWLRVQRPVRRGHADRCGDHGARAAWLAGGLGVVMLAVALVLLVRGHRQRRALLARRDELQRALSGN